jgi:hypothetical protein
MLLSISASRFLNFLSFCNFVITRITTLLTELYRFNLKPAPILISGSECMGRIKYMATSRGSFSVPQRTAFMVTGWHQTKGGHVDIEQIGCLFEQIDKLLIIRFIDKKICPPTGTVHHMVPGIRIGYSQRARHGAYTSDLIIKVNRGLDP